jgi:hypothetical protein
VTSLHIAVVGDPDGPGGVGPGTPRWFRVAPDPGSGFEDLPGFAAYGRALLTNDLVAEHRGAVVLLAGSPAVTEPQVSHCLRQLDGGHPSAGPRLWGDEFDRLCEAGETSIGLFAIQRHDWDRLDGLSEYLPFGFIGDLERRASEAGVPVARTDGQLGDEAVGDDLLAYGLTLLSRTGKSRQARVAARKMIKRLLQNGRLSRESVAEGVRSATSAARDVLHLRRTQRDRTNR